MSRGLDHARLDAIGQRGKARRHELGLTVAQVAERIGFTDPKRLYNLECYGAGMISTVDRWARALDMDPAVLAFGSRETDVCWHCRVCLVPAVRHCELCPPEGDCDVEGCQQPGCEGRR